MERFEKIVKALIIEEDIDYNDIIKAIDTAISNFEKEKILEELCSYVAADFGPDDILECYI